jgi:hypothetical protein
MLNKAAFAKVAFNYPYALSTIHMACNVIGATLYFAFVRGQKPKNIDGANRNSILLFSVVFSLNIAIGNTSLQFVSVNFNQVCRALVPVIVMLISMFCFRRTYSSERKWAVIPIVLGVATAFYGDFRYTTWGKLIQIGTTLSTMIDNAHCIIRTQEYSTPVCVWC